MSNKVSLTKFLNFGIDFKVKGFNRSSVPWSSPEEKKYLKNFFIDNLK